MARLPLREHSDVPEEFQYLLESEVGDLNMIRAIANNPPILQSYLRWGKVLAEDSGLDRRQFELVVLTSAAALDAPYEWQQHVSFAVDAGLTEAGLRELADGGVPTTEADERALVEYVRAFVRNDVTPEEHEALVESFDDGQIVGIVMVCSFYLANAYIVDALDVAVDGEFLGWDLGRFDA